MAERKKTNIEKYNESLSAEERKERALAAAAKSGPARVQHRLFRDIIKDIMAAPIAPGQEADALKALGLKANHENAILLAAAQKASSGDIEAVRFLRDTLGEKPTESFNVGVQGKPIQALDLSKLSDEELEALADGQ